MSFDIDKCIIKQVYCGRSNIIPAKDKKRYSKVGSRDECLKKGFGAGMYNEKVKHLPQTSLQNIK